MIERLINYIYLLFYFFIRKKNSTVIDITVPIWRAKLTDKDVDRYVISFSITGSEVKGTFVIIGIGKCGDRISKDVHLQLITIPNVKTIDTCNFKEFRKYYGSYILYLRDIDRTMDIFGR